LWEITVMDTATVEKDLNTRIEQSRAWLLGAPATIANIAFRKRTWTATPIAFLDDPERIERYGVAFRFSLEDQSRNICVLLRIRIKPGATIGEKGDSPPYVVTYICNPASEADEVITWHHIEIPASYRDMMELSIEDWYRKWMAHALASKGASKILDPHMALHK
jgi:hypothetical protein